MLKQKMKNVNSHKDNYQPQIDKYQINSDSEQSEQSETEAVSSKVISIPKALLKEISNTLTLIISKNKKHKKEKNENTPFNDEHAPKISILDYLIRIQKYSRIENSTIITALIYIDRICIKKHIILSKYNIHRILFSSILVSIKYNEDIIYGNNFYSQIAGVTVAELKKLEYEFLKLIDFDLYVSSKLYQKYDEYLKFKDMVSNE